jgi:hypothetical protein
MSSTSTSGLPEPIFLNKTVPGSHTAERIASTLYPDSDSLKPHYVRETIAWEMHETYVLVIKYV